MSTSALGRCKYSLIRFVDHAPAEKVTRTIRSHRSWGTLTVFDFYRAGPALETEAVDVRLHHPQSKQVPV